MGTGTAEAEAGGDMGREVGDGFELGSEEEPAPAEAVIPLCPPEKAAVVEQQPKPHRRWRRRRGHRWFGRRREGFLVFFRS